MIKKPKIGIATLDEVIWNSVKRIKTAEQFKVWIDSWTAEVRREERLRARRRRKKL